MIHDTYGLQTCDGCRSTSPARAWPEAYGLKPAGMCAGCRRCSRPALSAVTALCKPSALSGRQRALTSKSLALSDAAGSPDQSRALLCCGARSSRDCGSSAMLRPQTARLTYGHSAARRSAYWLRSCHILNLAGLSARPPYGPEPRRDAPLRRPVHAEANHHATACPHVPGNHPCMQTDLRSHLLHHTHPDRIRQQAACSTIGAAQLGGFLLKSCRVQHSLPQITSQELLASYTGRRSLSDGR